MNKLLARSRPNLRVAVDTKNLALYTGGIAAFFRPLLRAWIAARPQWDFVLVGPPFKCDDLVTLPNCSLQQVPWPTGLPRPLRHPYYDNFLFPRRVRAAQPDAIFTPYHDVRLPSSIPSVMMVHDTCLHDLPDVYPLRLRAYYLHMLRRNLTVAKRVLTVSQTSRRDLLARYGVADARTGVVPNAINPDLTESPTAPVRAMQLRAERPSGIHLFYPGGSEHRKNIGRLSQAIVELTRAGESVHLWITGSKDAAWTGCLADLAPTDAARFNFLGKLDLDGLAAQYRACDAVVYPTLCEGFGRVALEAMEMGISVACSDIPVLREVAADYPVYFDPRQTTSIAAGIRTAAQAGPRAPRRCDEFQPARVVQAFIAQMDAAFADL